MWWFGLEDTPALFSPRWDGHGHCLTRLVCIRGGTACRSAQGAPQLGSRAPVHRGAGVQSSVAGLWAVRARRLPPFVSACGGGTRLQVGRCLWRCLWRQCAEGVVEARGARRTPALSSPGRFCPGPGWQSAEAGGSRAEGPVYRVVVAVGRCLAFVSC